ncbi:MAG: hypothetical protein ABSF22_15915 [Bryobacteraceae bacterium]|jgi:hypothetical protein
MISRACLLFLPLLLAAQEQAPPEVDEALRARVTGFYHYFVEGSFSPRKAEGFVAEDTKDYFYNAGKDKFLSFKIDTITYGDHFTKALVMVIGKERKMVLGHVVDMDKPMATRWKIEDGMWCWTYDPGDIACTPMGGKCGSGSGGSAEPALKPPVVVPKDPAAVVRKAPMGIDKGQVTLGTSEPGSVQVVFTNGAEGPVQVGLDGPSVRGFSYTWDQTSVPGHGTAVLTLKYDPADKSGPKDVWDAKGKIMFRVVVAPFNRMFPVYVVFPTPR